MLFAPVCIGNKLLSREIAAEDRKNCKKFGPCGVGLRAVHLGSLFIDRRCYIAINDVRRVFKRVAMSSGGFTGKGIFGAIPYFVVECTDGTEKQCAFKREEQVDAMLDYFKQKNPEIPVLSAAAERRLEEEARAGASRFSCELTEAALAACSKLEKAKTLLSKYPQLTKRLSAAAKAKRVNEATKPGYRAVAFIILLIGIVVAAFGATAMLNKNDFGVYFMLFGMAAIFLFSGTRVMPTMKNNRRAVCREYDEALAELAAVLPGSFPLPEYYAHPVVLDRMLRVLREGRAQNISEALETVKADLKKLNSDVRVSRKEYDEIVAVKPMFLLKNYQ